MYTVDMIGVRLMMVNKYELKRAQTVAPVKILNTFLILPCRQMEADQFSHLNKK